MDRDVQRGTYTITNVMSKTALTLAAHDDRSVVGLEHAKNGSGKNQQWIIDNLGDGYSIRSARSQGYLSFGCPSLDGPPIIAVPHPATWILEHEPGEEAGDVFRINWPNGNFVLCLDARTPVPIPKVVLWTMVKDAKNELWRLKRLPDSDLSGTEVTTSSGRTMTRTTTTTTTTTTVVTTEPEN